METVDEVIKPMAMKHERKLHNHTNIPVLQLLYHSEELKKTAETQEDETIRSDAIG